MVVPPQPQGALDERMAARARSEGRFRRPDLHPNDSVVGSPIEMAVRGEFAIRDHTVGARIPIGRPSWKSDTPSQRDARRVLTLSILKSSPREFRRRTAGQPYVATSTQALAKRGWADGAVRLMGEIAKNVEE